MNYRRFAEELALRRVLLVRAADILAGLGCNAMAEERRDRLRQMNMLAMIYGPILRLLEPLNPLRL